MPSNNVSIVRRAMNHISKPQVEKNVGQVMLSGGTIAAVGFFATKGVAVLAGASGAALAATGWGVIALVVAGLFLALHGAYRAHKAAQQEKAAQQASLANKKVEVEEIEMKNVVGEGFSQPKSEVKCKVELPGQEPRDFDELFEQIKSDVNSGRYAKAKIEEETESDTDSVSEAEPKVVTYEDHLSHLSDLSLDPEENKEEIELLSEEDQNIVRVFEALDPGLRCVDEFQARLESLKGNENYSAIVAKASKYLSQEEPEDVDDARNILATRAYLENERVSKGKTSVYSLTSKTDSEVSPKLEKEQISGNESEEAQKDNPVIIPLSKTSIMREAANLSLAVLTFGTGLAVYLRILSFKDLISPAVETMQADFGFMRA